MAYTPEKKEKQRKYNAAHYGKISDNPELKKVKIQKQVEANAKYIANLTPKQKEARKAYQREYKRAQRAQKKQSRVVNIPPSTFSQIKQIQMRTACEIAEEL